MNSLTHRLRDAYHGEIPANQEPLLLEAANEIERLTFTPAELEVMNDSLTALQELMGQLVVAGKIESDEEAHPFIAAKRVALNSALAKVRTLQGAVL